MCESVSHIMADCRLLGVAEALLAVKALLCVSIPPLLLLLASVIERAEIIASCCCLIALMVALISLISTALGF